MRIVSGRSAVIGTGLLFGTAVLLSALGAPPYPSFIPPGENIPGPASLKTGHYGQSAQSAAQQIVLTLNPAKCKVGYSVDSTLHMVHGTFNLKSGSVQFDPGSGKAGGEIVVYVTSGDSGNSSRDEKMHKEVLQSAKYPDAVFHPSQVEGRVAPAASSDVQLHGTILLHGQEHEIVAPVHAELAANHWSGTANFDVPYIQWGMKDPSNWLLKVKPVVHVELEMAGSVSQTTAAK
jgi:polyisoprenoid-binding protein YceI